MSRFRERVDPQYDLIDWTAEVPPNQSIALEAGIYHLTLCSWGVPAGGVLGDDQVVDVYFNELDEFPVLAHQGLHCSIRNRERFRSL